MRKFGMMALVVLSGCSSGSERIVPERRASTTKIAEVPQVGRPVALIGNQAVSFDALALRMAELGGGRILEELALDRALDAEMGRAGIRVSASDIAREREMLIANVGEESGTGADQAERLLDRVRASRGLGPIRFDELLTRNAKLRTLVRDQITITPELLEREVMVQTLPRIRIRLLVNTNQNTVAQARTSVLASPANLRPAVFAEAAMGLSTDSSAPVGGLLPAIHAQDIAVPSTIRDALGRLQPGEVSDLLALDQGFAIVLMEGPARAAIGGGSRDADVRAQVERKLRGRLERLSMDILAERLVRESNVRALDASLGWSWENLRR